MPAPSAPDPLLPEAPLAELTRDRRTAFLLLCFTPDELLDLAKGLGLTVPGYRPEHLADADLADLIADELPGSRHVRRRVQERLVEALGAPALADLPLEPALAARLAEALVDEAPLERVLWRLLSDRSPEVRASAGAALERLAAELLAEPPPDEPAEPPVEAATPGPAGPVAAAAEGVGARLREATRATRRAERERDRALRERERTLALVAKGKDQLREARAAAAAAVREASAARKAGRSAATKVEKLEAALAEARGKAGAGLGTRLRRALEKAEHRIAELEAERAARGNLPAHDGPPPAPAEAAAARATESAAWPAEPLAAPSASAAPPADGVEAAPAAWLLPVYTREFYDSLRGWDRRIQRAAFKQAHLLAQDHRHPSLRALPLEGLPNLYRVRVATDVRLLYRRGEGHTVELLSLIDREDLDRYIKQAKERA